MKNKKYFGISMVIALIITIGVVVVRQTRFEEKMDLYNIYLTDGKKADPITKVLFNTLPTGETYSRASDEELMTFLNEVPTDADITHETRMGASYLEIKRDTDVPSYIEVAHLDSGSYFLQTYAWQGTSAKFNISRLGKPLDSKVFIKLVWVDENEIIVKAESYQFNVLSK